MSMQSKIIQFYSCNESYGEFSNFYEAPFTLRGSRWKTVEHFFQAQKPIEKALQRKIMKANSPALAAKLGRARGMKIQPNWDRMRLSVMHEGVLEKFSQNERLKEFLLSTGDAKLVERTENDSFWGDVGDGSGENHLGRILMKIREQLANAK